MLNMNQQPLHWRSNYDKNVAIPALQFSIRKVLNWDLGRDNLLYTYTPKPRSYWQVLVNKMSKLQRKHTRDRLVDKKFTSIKNFDERQYAKFHQEQTQVQQEILRSEAGNPQQELTYYGIAHVGDLSNFDSRFFGLSLDDRLGHTVITGNSGFGKSLLMQNIFFQDVLNGRGCAFVSSDNAGCQRVLSSIPEHFRSKIIYWQPGNPDFEFGVDIFDSPNPKMVLEIVLSIFGSIWQGESSDKISYFLEPILVLIKDNPTLAKFSDYYRIIDDIDFRNKLLTNCLDTKTITFWNDLKPSAKSEMISTLIKLEYINRNQIIKEVLENKNKVLRLQKIVEKGLILIVDLSLLNHGEASGRLIGNLVIKKICECKSDSFFGLFVDEFWNYSGQDILSKTSNLRQNKISLCYSQQGISCNTENPLSEINFFRKFSTKILFNCNEPYSKIMNYPEEYEYDNKLKNLPKYCFWMDATLSGMPVNSIIGSFLPELIDGFVAKINFTNNADYFENYNAKNSNYKIFENNSKEKNQVKNSTTYKDLIHEIDALNDTLNDTPNIETTKIKQIKNLILIETQKLTHDKDGKLRKSNLNFIRRSKIQRRIQELESQIKVAK
jgi:hypothetical protein